MTTQSALFADSATPASEAGAAAIDFAGRVGAEWVIKVHGKVAKRLEGKVNERLDTGEIELRCASVEVLNPSAPPPFVPNQSDLPNEDAS